MPYYNRPPVFTYTNPPRLFHRQPPSPPGGSPGTSSGELAASPPPMKRDYDEASEYALLHPEGQSSGYSHSMHDISGMGSDMGFVHNSLNLSFPTDMLTGHHHHHQQYMPTVPPMQHAYPTGGFPVMAHLGDALDEHYERGGAYSPSDHGGSDSGSSNATYAMPSDYETEKFLREHLRIAEPAPLNLDAIADDRAKISTLIILSIWSSPEKRLTLKGIYDAIEARFPQRKAANDKPWQRSIRHNLSLKAMFVYEERPTSHPGKGRYWRIDVSKGTGNKRNRKRKLGPSGGRKDGDDGEEEEDVYDDEDEDEAGSRVQGRSKQYGGRSPHRLENNAGTPVFTYPDGTSLDPSRGLTQSPPMSLTSGQDMNYLMPNFPSSVDQFHPNSAPYRGPFPNMNPTQFGNRSTMKSFPSTGTAYTPVPSPGPPRAMSLPPQRHVYHPAPHVELPRRHTTAAFGRHQQQHAYGGGVMSHPPIPDSALMQQGSSQNRSPLRGPSDSSSPNAGNQETSRKRRLR